MTTPIDILFDTTTGDLKVVSGDLVAGDSTFQHQYDIIMADKAHYHTDPAIGVGATNYILDQTTMPGLTKAIRVELERDGMDVESVVIQADGSIQVLASYPDELYSTKQPAKLV